MSGRIATVAGALLLALVVAACSAKTGTGSLGTVPRSSSQVDVLYAGSLVDVMTNTVGPAFEKATGYTFVGYSDGSTALASDIRGRVKQGDVFVSASPSADTSLEGSANGAWVSWYATFASTNLVLGYNPKSKFAGQLKTTPWYEVVGQPGFRLGFTDPATDPKGMLAVSTLNQAATKYHQPALAEAAKLKNDQFAETALVGELQSGQLDAGFFYTVEATAARVQTVGLAPLKVASPYTITVLARAPHPAGADAFVNFLLGTQGQALLSKLDLSVVTPPTVRGTGVPGALDSILHVSP
ncbi:MAG: extracellular solute-binding protein [Acidimicrobiales bacterium]